QGNVDIALARSEHGIRVVVSDTGPGIAQAQRQLLFKRPSSLGPHAGDRGGLGLLIVKRMLQLHHTDIRLLDHESRGATFEFEVPAAVI
ncbi:MAG: ATP-binding protein, partial [Comamonadaceae bacterium]